MAACVFKEYTRNFGLWSHYQKYCLLFVIPRGPITMLGAYCPLYGLLRVNCEYTEETWTLWNLATH